MKRRSRVPGRNLLLIAAGMGALDWATEAPIWKVGMLLFSLLAGVALVRDVLRGGPEPRTPVPIRLTPRFSAPVKLPAPEGYGPDGQRVLGFLDRVGTFDTATWERVVFAAQALRLAKGSNDDRLGVTGRALRRYSRTLSRSEWRALLRVNAQVREVIHGLRRRAFPPDLPSEIVFEVKSVAYALVIRRHLTNEEWGTIRELFAPFCPEDELA